MRLPCLTRDHAAITNSLLLYECSTCLLCFPANMFIAGNALAFREAGSGEHLYAMAYGEDPFLLRVEFAHNPQQAPVIAQIFRSAAAQNQDGVIITHIHLVE